MIPGLRSLLPRRRVSLPWEQKPLSPRKRWMVRAALALALFAATLFLFPVQSRFDPPDYLEGTIASEEILAPMRFDVLKAENDQDRERALAAEAVPLVFRKTDGQALINDNVAGLDLARHDPGLLQAYLDQRQVTLSPETRRVLAHPDSGAVLVRELGRLLTSAESAGLVAEEDAELLLRRQRERVQIQFGSGTQQVATRSIYDYRRLSDEGATRGRQVLGNTGEAVLSELVVTLARANVQYDHQATELDRTVARDNISPINRTVEKGERIVDAHERITPEHVVTLQAMEEALAGNTTGGGIQGWLFPLLGRALLVGLMVVLIGVSLSVSRPRIWQSLKKTTLLATVALATLGLAALVVRTQSLHPYLIPIPFAAVLITLLLDDLVAMVMVAWLAALIGTVTGWGMGVTLVGFVGGAAAVYSVRNVTHRFEIYRSMLLVFLAMVAAVIGVLLVGRGVPWATLWRDMMWAAANAVVCTAAAMLILPFFEKLFDLVTNVSLLELGDLNRPIFKRMMIEANGTYHHSMVIGSLAEAAAEAVNANPLLARVGAYYHDIGKIAKSTYFGENIQKGTRNPHERLTPTMSSLILESHVREGLELAAEIGLPGQVAAFIPEHQGTTLMQYFYNKALEMDPEVDESDYRYPGPKPQSKETAIVMLGDSAEATVRSLDDQSTNKIRAVLGRTFDMRIADGQLDDSGLTIRDMALIREAFTHVLTGVFHGRVKYQWQKDGKEAEMGGAQEQVFYPELETGIGTTELPRSGAYAGVPQTSNPKTRD